MRQNLKRVLRDIDDAVEQALDDAADDLLDRATALSPQLTGAHIHTGTVHNTGGHQRVVTFAMPYSVFLHEGTYKLGPISSKKPSTPDGDVGKKFLSRPFDAHKSRYIADIGRAIGDEINRSLR